MGRQGLSCDEAAGAGAGAQFRPDVEGLRGVAILLVLLFHGAFPVPGGFVGVDVFLVISGFLITGLLLRELETTGRIDLLAFYGRRLRRLLPAAVVVTVVVMPLAFAALPPLDKSSAMTDGAAAILVLSNIRSALAEGDYFAAVSTPSPFLHFWSLSLEEQFYMVWPFLLLVVVHRRWVRVTAGVALVVLLVASLATSVVLTERAATWGFYSLPSRAWQFAAGGLLAVAATLLRRLPDIPVVVAGWLGVLGIGVAAFAIDGSVPYPGLLAVLPTAAAALVILAGDRRRGPGLLLRVRPLRFLGRISYSLYLWHWPILVLPVAAGALIGPLETGALLALSVVVAWASWAFVEEPFRKAHRARRTMTRLSIQLGTAAIVGVVAWSGLLGVSADVAIAGISGGSAAIDGGPVTAEVDGGPVATGSHDGPTNAAVVTVPPSSSPTTPAADPSAGLASAPPTAASGSAPVATPVVALISWTEIPDQRLPGSVRLPRDVAPALADARTDRERLPDDGCFSWLDATKPADCVYGDADGAITVALIGDSHAGHWFPAFNVLAGRYGWRLLPYVKASCPFIDIPVVHPFAKREYTECEAWRGLAIKAINEARPNLVVVVTAYRGIRPVNAEDGSVEVQGEAMAREIAKLEAPTAILVDTPRTGIDVPTCLSRHPRDVNACAIPRDVAFYDTFGVREQIAAKRSGATVIDIVAAVCPSTPCPVVRDGMILYRDGHHLTATFVRSLAPVLGLALDPLLAPAAGPRSTSSAAPSSQSVSQLTDGQGSCRIASAAHASSSVITRYIVVSVW
jgi:peptidoglycan/LPS O-acetylase OafA/YrhL